MAWCEANDIKYMFALGGNDVLDRQVDVAADDVPVRHAEGEAPVVRRSAEPRCGAKAWKCQRRVATSIEASCNGLDIRYVVTIIARGSAEWFYEMLYCEHGQTENLVQAAQEPTGFQTEPVAARRWPTRSGCCCTPPPTG
jgi:Transposase DDE domain group 1